MSGEPIEGLQGAVFRVLPEHIPKSKPETYRRLHYYVAKLGVTVSDSLQDTLIKLRQSADHIGDPEARTMARKGFNDGEFLPAVKEILVVWLHLEAMDQGGKDMPSWLLTFLRLAFGATDLLIPHPSATEILKSYDCCDDTQSLLIENCHRVAFALGFRSHASIFAAAVSPVVIETSALRQQVLQKALVLPLESLQTQNL